MAINQDIVDRYVEYRAWLIRYENRVASDVLEVLLRGEEQSLGAIAAAFEDVYPRGVTGTASDWRGKLFREKALRRVRAALADVFPEAKKSLRASLTDLAATVDEEFIETLRDLLPDPVIDELQPSRVPERQIANMLDDAFGDRLEGSAASVLTALDKVQADAVSRVAVALQDGIRDGVGMRQLQSTVRGIVGAGKGSQLARDVNTYVRTMVQTTANDVAGMTYRENSDIIRAEQYIATLDEDTCPICGPLDGQVFPIRNGKSTVPRPPRHPNCRCFVSPVLDDWKAMGLPDNLPKAIKRNLDGKPAQKTKWSDWVQRNPERLERVLGPGRADLIRSGRVTLKDLATTTDVITLDQLRTRRAA